MDAQRIAHFSTITTWQPLTQNSQQAPANLQNRYLFEKPGISQQTLYRTDELSYVRATLKHQLTDRYRYRIDFSRSRNRELKLYIALSVDVLVVLSVPQ